MTDPQHPDPEVVAIAREILAALLAAIERGDIDAVEGVVLRYRGRPKSAEAMLLVRARLAELLPEDDDRG
jgi:hypothetical protein